MAGLGFLILFLILIIGGSAIALFVGMIFLSIYGISKLLGKTPEKALLSSAAICVIPSALILIIFLLIT